MNGEYPKEIDSATVIAYAFVGPENQHTGNTKHTVGGDVMGPAKAMAIAQYAGDDSYYLFGCYFDERSSGTDTWHQNLEDAVRQLDWEYKGLSKALVWYIKP